MKITNELCINEIKRIYQEHGKVTNKLIKEYSSISSDSIKRRFGTLVNAYKEAGINLKQGQRKQTSKEEITKANIAIEYNGPQHYFIDGRYTKDQEALDYRKTLDMIKYDLIKKHNIHLIVISFKDKIDNNYINSKLKTKK